MTDDIVARLRYEQELCAVMGDTKAGTLVGEAADRLEAAEARVRELEAQLADQRAMSKYNREQAEKAERALAKAWEPIESAPRDGTEFQAWMGYWEPRCRINPDTEAFEIWGRVDYDQDGWDTYLHLAPTHWMPLPEPPATKEAGEQ